MTAVSTPQLATFFVVRRREWPLGDGCGHAVVPLPTARKVLVSRR